MVETCDYLIIGGGIVGLTIARAIKRRSPKAHITVIEKEVEVARHGSGRNSGVLHAGFYYPADSLKARFCRMATTPCRLIAGSITSPSTHRASW